MTRCHLEPVLFLAAICVAGLAAALTTRIPPVEEGMTAHFAQKRLKAIGIIAAVGGALGVLARLPAIITCLFGNR